MAHLVVGFYADEGKSVDVEQAAGGQLEFRNDGKSHETEGHERFDVFGDTEFRTRGNEHIVKDRIDFLRIGRRS